MNAVEFLQTVIADTGYYCSLVIRPNDGGRRQKFFTSVQALVDSANNMEYPGLISADTMKRSLKQHQRTTEQVKRYGGVTISSRTQKIIDAMNAEWEE